MVAGIDVYTWLLVLSAVQATVLGADAFVGHYRSGFALRAQYVPLVVAAALGASALVAAIAPALWGTARAAVIAGALAVVSGIVGLGYHHWYGISTKPGAYRWLLHHLLHHAPPLLPLALSAAGALQVIAAWGLLGNDQLLGMSIRVVGLTIVGIALLSLTLQVALLHYRGAYNNAAMYIPLAILPLAAAAALWNAAVPGETSGTIATWLFSATFVTGLLGAGMHLRGMDRQMGGLHMGIAAIIDAPLPGAPLLVAAFGGSGFMAMRLP